MVSLSFLHSLLAFARSSGQASGRALSLFIASHRRCRRPQASQIALNWLKRQNPKPTYLPRYETNDSASTSCVPNGQQKGEKLRNSPNKMECQNTYAGLHFSE